MQKQRLKQNQSLQLSPKQIQFLSLLQIPVMSLQKRIEDELENNPALEENEEEDNEEAWERSSSSSYAKSSTASIFACYVA
jgi:RNA polymerase sigma-54 factor